MADGNKVPDYSFKEQSSNDEQYKRNCDDLNIEQLIIELRRVERTNDPKLWTPPVTRQLELRIDWLKDRIIDFVELEVENSNAELCSNKGKE